MTVKDALAALDEELLTLLDHVLTGPLSPDDQQRLHERLSADRPARVAALLYLNMHATLPRQRRCNVACMFR